MLLAPALKAPPREIAEQLGAALQERLGAQVDHVEVAGPGFLNIFLADDWYTGAAAHVLAAGDGYGGGTADPPEKIQVEFVSANPTGPLTAASRPPRRLRRLAAAPVPLPGPRGRGRVLLQRHRRADPQVRRVDHRPRARRGAARRAATRATTSPSSRARSRARRSSTPTPWPPRACRGSWSGSAPRSRATTSSSTTGSASASLHEGDPSPVQRALDDLARGRHLPRRRRAVAADQGARRRQRGPRAGAPHGRADLLRVRRRLRGVQARARLRPLLHRARLRPPRLHRAHEGRPWRRSARTRRGSRSRCCSSCTSSSAARRPRCPSAAATSSCSTT